MPNMHEEIDWELIVDRIKSGQCTPFLGAGACYEELPLASEIAENWAKDYGYPMKDYTDLARVAEFLAIKDPLAPKEKLRKRFKTVPTPDFMKEDEPHGVLADLPFPIYITTNYDDFMEQALKSRNKDPKSEVCLWYPYPSNKKPPSVFDSDYVPTPEKPVVFHLHGRIDIPDSLVLTEDDYLDFLKKISEEQALLPPPIEEAFTANSLLFLGYRLADWNFRVIFRSLKSYLGKSFGRSHLSVQLVPKGDILSEDREERAVQYLDQYFKREQIQIYWGTCQDFVTELKSRWEVCA